jgi:hypothetical protein
MIKCGEDSLIQNFVNHGLLCLALEHLRADFPDAEFSFDLLVCFLSDENLVRLSDRFQPGSGIHSVSDNRIVQAFRRCQTCFLNQTLLWPQHNPSGFFGPQAQLSRHHPFSQTELQKPPSGHPPSTCPGCHRTRR